MSSSLVSITVEHPQQTQRFEVWVSLAASIRDVKEQIARLCPGNPDAAGQRLICKGRVLRDIEIVDHVWKSENEARVVHLAVNPHAWTTSPAAPAPFKTPPTSPVEVPSLSSLRQEIDSLQRQAHAAALVRDLLMARHRQRTQVATPSPFGRPMGSRQPPINLNPESVTLPFFNTHPFIRRLHYKALRALSVSTPSPPEEPELPPLSKEMAMVTLEAMDIRWNTIFDAEFPEPSDGGVTYEFTLIAGKPYLQNLTPHSTPTPRQKHALDVLAATFPLLSLHIPAALVAPLPEANLLAGGVGVGGPNEGGRLRLRLGINVNGRQHALNLRILITPLLLLALRTLILFYFFTPARKPVFSVILGAYVLYEAWAVFRGAMREEGAGDGNRNADRAQPNQNANGFQANPDPRAAQMRGRVAADTVVSAVNHLAQLNFDNETRWLENNGPEPGVFTKMRIFVSLFVLSLHPGYWNRRRAALRTREGALRTEANAREAAIREAAQAQQEGEADETDNARQQREQMIARQAQRPVWIREYIERVRQGDWADE